MLDTAQGAMTDETKRRKLLSSATDAALDFFLKILPSMPVPPFEGVKDGLVSNHINDVVSSGSTIEVMPPEGNFYVDVNETNSKTYYLFAAGSGITPILSILKSILLIEKNSMVYLIYGEMV